jgi:hypothetical protein
VARRIRTSPVVLALCFGLLAAAIAAGPAGAKAPAASDRLAPVVRMAERFDTSPPLRTFPQRVGRVGHEEEDVEFPPVIEAGATPGVDPALDTIAADAPMPGTRQNFEGIDNIDGVLPPDTNGDVGPNHYVQMVNSNFAIWDKAGKLVYGPTANNTLWTGLGGPCEQVNAGDPIVLYDHLAGRWLLSQFAPTDTEEDGNGPYYECIAISKTSDPTGSYHRYAFLYDHDIFNDYPHLGVWPDAYYMSVNQFTGANGAGAVAYERERMLQGLPARQVIFHLQTANPSFRGQLAADLDGPPPPPGTPGIFAEIDDSSRIGPVDALRIWQFHVDWTNPAASTMGLNGQPNQVIPVASFNMMLCHQTPSSLPRTRFCIIQPGPPLDSLGERLMFRLVYRNFGDHQALLANHTVDANGLQHAGVRWYELRSTGGPWSIAQQSTFAPDADNRWMAGIAMDNDQGIGLGYSVAGPATFPGIRYAGRLVTDPPNSLPQTETSIVEGEGSQLYPDPTQSRWGDYSSMSIDSVDDCTFWYTQEYTASFDLAPWQTRVGSFAFPSCTPPPTGTLQGTVFDASTRKGVPGAFVQAGAYSTSADRDGKYRLPPLPPGTYAVTASAQGYAPQTVSLNVGAGGLVNRNFSLTPVSVSTVTGTVLDGGGQGWPLYARIDIPGFAGSPVFTNPVTGAFTARIPNGDYAFTVSAVGQGYDEATEAVSIPAAGPLSFSLAPAGSVCPPGYAKTGAGFTQPFEGGTIPDGWTVTDNAGLGSTWEFDNPGGRPNQTGGSGEFAVVDSDFAGPVATQDTELISPKVDFTSVAKVTLEFDTHFHWYSGGLPETGDVDVSADDGDTWTNVWTRSEDYPGPHHEVIDVSSVAAHKSAVRVRYHYYTASWEYWWEVDNVALGNPGCTPLGGGLVVGVVAGPGGAGLNGATVKGVKVPGDSATTMATPEDPLTSDGLYILFSSLTGKVAFTASAAGHPSLTRTTLVQAARVANLRFQLR